MKHPELPRLKSLSAVTRRLHRPEHGQTLVEFALMFPVLVLILMGAVDLGHGIYAFGVISSAAREGARYGITNPDDHPGMVTIATANTEALDKSRITVTTTKVCPAPPSPCSGGYGQIIVVVSYDFQPVTLLFAPLTLTGQSTMYLE